MNEYHSLTFSSHSLLQLELVYEFLIFFNILRSLFVCTQYNSFTHSNTHFGSIFDVLRYVTRMDRSGDLVKLATKLKYAVFQINSSIKFLTEFFFSFLGFSSIKH